MEAGVLLLLPGAVESDLVQALHAPGSGTRVVRRCADVAEVLAAAAAGLGAVAVLGAEVPGVDRTVVATLRQAQVRTVLLAPDDDVPRVEMLGPDAVVPLAAGTTGLAARTVELAHRSVAAAPVPSLAAQARHDAPGRHLTAQAHRDAPPGPVASSPRPAEPADSQVLPGQGAPAGRLVAVWGTPGAPGRTTVAVNLAAELASPEAPALLIDADTQAPATAEVLGVVEDSAGVAAAARLVVQGRLDPDALRSLCRAVDPHLWVLTGLTRADRWRELPAAALEVLWQRAREIAPWSVVDLAAGAEAEPGGFGPRRHEATLSALAAADVVVVVGAGDPVGVRRLVGTLAEMQDRQLTGRGCRQVVVVNRVRASAAGRTPRRAVVDALTRFADVTDPLLVPQDTAAVDRAVLAGRVLAESAPASPTRQALAELALRVADVPVTRRRRRHVRR